MIHDATEGVQKLHGLAMIRVAGSSMLFTSLCRQPSVVTRGFKDWNHAHQTGVINAVPMGMATDTRRWTVIDLWDRSSQQGLFGCSYGVLPTKVYPNQYATTECSSNYVAHQSSLYFTLSA